MKNLIELSWKTLLATLLVFIGTMASGALVQSLFGNVWGEMPGTDGLLLPMLLSSALLVISLVAVSRLSVLSRWPLFLALFLACLGVNVLLMQVEAAAFLEMSPIQLAASVTHATLSAAILCLVAAWLFGRRNDLGDSRELPGVYGTRWWATRIGTAAFAYLLLYLVAGMLIYPKVQTFYESNNFEAGPWILPLAFVRGALYVAFSLWLIRSLHCSRMECALAIAIMFPVLAGVAALMVPNGFMPGDVRFWHALEVGWSNFVFGFLVGWMFWLPGHAPGELPTARADSPPALRP